VRGDFAGRIGRKSKRLAAINRRFPQLPGRTECRRETRHHQAGGIRELHWHPNASKWQFYIAGKGRMTVFSPVGNARTMDFHANDVGYVPAVAGHYVENTGDTDLVFLELFKASEFLDFSLNNWIRRLPPEMVASHLNLDEDDIKKIPAENQALIGEKK
jgi:oxalate decarboxylase